MLPEKTGESCCFVFESVYLVSVKAILFFIPFLSFYISRSMIYPYMTGKNFAFRILVEIAAVLWLGLAVLDKKYRLKNSVMLIFVLAFTFIIGLADILGVNPYNSLWSGYERMDGYLTILHLCVYFMIIKSVFKTRTDWLIFFNIIALVSLLINADALFNILRHKYSLMNGIYLVLQKVGYLGTNDSTFFRPIGRIGNAAFFASYLVLAILIKIILVINFRQLWLRMIYLLAVGLDLLFIYFTATRGAMLGIAVGIISFCLICFFVKPKSSEDRFFRKIAISIISGIFILSAVFFMVRDTDFIKQDRTLSRLTQISTSDPTTQLRLITWQMAWEGVKERPILGWGQENFPHVYTKYFHPKIYGLETWLDRTHNAVLDWLVNAGFLGLLSYLGLFGAVFFSLRTALKNKIISIAGAAAVSAGIIAYFIQNLFIFDTINTYIIFFSLLAYTDALSAAGVSAKQGSRISEIEGSRKAGGSRASGFFNVKIRSVCTVALALLILGYAAYFVNYKPIKQSRMLTHLSVSPTPYSSYFAVLYDFRQALAYNTFGDKHVVRSMAAISDSILKTKSLYVEGAPEFIEATAVELEKYVAADPGNLERLPPFINLLHGIAEYDASFIEKAEVYIREALRMSPTHQWVYFALADNYSLKNDNKSALSAIQKAVELDSEKAESQLKLAMAAILNSENDLAESALEKVKEIRAAEDRDVALGRKSPFLNTELYGLARVSVNTRNYLFAIRFYKELIANNPEDAQFHLDIAKIYLVSGDKVKAIEEAMIAAEIDPENYASAVKEFIDRIE